MVERSMREESGWVGFLERVRGTVFEGLGV